jgi:hypothetical protein
LNQNVDENIENKENGGKTEPKFDFLNIAD